MNLSNLEYEALVSLYPTNRLRCTNPPIFMSLDATAFEEPNWNRVEFPHREVSGVGLAERGLVNITQGPIAGECELSLTEAGRKAVEQACAQP